MEGLGTTSLWGLSQPIDFLNPSSVESDIETVSASSLAEISKSYSDNDPIKILLLGSSDLRHVLKTASRLNRKKEKRPVHFYILETQSTILARHMLHLSIFHDEVIEAEQKDGTSISLQERAELFLETFSNILLREKSSRFIQEKSSELIRVITDSKGPLSKLIDFGALKFRERDDLEFVFKFWRESETKRPFDVKVLWDHRLRTYLKRRYDTRENIFDWDYNMKLLERNPSATIIHRLEYTKWREHGNAHEVRESHYEFPNRTMATVDCLMQDGLKVNKWGLFSDILVGPFSSFSVDTEHKEYLKKANDKHQYPCQVIAELNIKSMIHELNTGLIYVPDQPLNITELPSEDTQTKPFIPIDHIKIFFLPCNPVETLIKKKAKFLDSFHYIYVSSALAHRVPECTPLLKSGGIGSMFIETANMMLDLNKEQVAAYLDKIDEMAASAGLIRNEELTSGKDFVIFNKIC